MAVTSMATFADQCDRHNVDQVAAAGSVLSMKVETAVVTASRVSRHVVRGETRMPPDAQPKTIPALGSGQMLRRDVRPFVVANKGETLVVDMPGHDLEGEGVPIGDDMIVVDRAPRSLEETVGAVPRPPKIRRVRVKLKLSQRQGGLGAPGRRESFDTDERGLVEPSGPTLQFVRILDRHPEVAEVLPSGGAPLARLTGGQTAQPRPRVAEGGARTVLPAQHSHDPRFGLRRAEFGLCRHARPGRHRDVVP